MAQVKTSTGLELDTSFTGASNSFTAGTPTIEDFLKRKKREEDAQKEEADKSKALQDRYLAQEGLGVGSVFSRRAELKKQKEDEHVKTQAELADEKSSKFSAGKKGEEEARKDSVFLQSVIASAKSLGNPFETSGNTNKSVTTRGKTTDAIDKSLASAEALYELNQSRYNRPDGSNMVEDLYHADKTLEYAQAELHKTQNDHKIVHFLFGNDFFPGQVRAVNQAAERRQLLATQIETANATKQNAASLIANFQGERILNTSASALNDTDKDLQNENFQYMTKLVGKAIVDGTLNLDIPAEQVPGFTKRMMEFQLNGSYANEMERHASTFRELTKRYPIVDEVARSEDPVGLLRGLLVGEAAFVEGSEPYLQAAATLSSYRSAFRKFYGFDSEFPTDEQEKFIKEYKMKDEAAQYAALGEFARNLKNKGQLEGVTGLAKAGMNVHIASPERVVDAISTSPVAEKISDDTKALLSSTKWFGKDPTRYYNTVIDNARSAIHGQGMTPAQKLEAIQTTARELSRVFEEQRKMTTLENAAWTNLEQVGLKHNFRDAATLDLGEGDSYLDITSYGTLLGILKLDYIGE